MIRPLHDLVLVRVIEDEARVSPGGIVYSPGSAKATKRAVVVRTGTGRLPYRAGGRWHTRPPQADQAITGWARHRVLPEVGEGDLVLYEDHSTRWHDGDGEWPETGDRALVPEHAIVMVIEAGDRVELDRIGAA